MMRATVHHSRNQTPPAFTLIELMVVVGIIILLAALTVGVSVSLSRNSEVRETEVILQLLDQAIQEWELANDRTITFAKNGQPLTGMIYDIDETEYGPSGTKKDEFQDQVLKMMLRNRDVTSIFAQFNETYFYRDDPNDTPTVRTDDEYVLLDAWDEKIHIVFPGRKHDPSYEADEGTDPDTDGTVRTDDENQYGICVNGRIAFVSAGPDGKFGNLHLADDLSAVMSDEFKKKDFDDAADNVYSYELSRERESPP